MRPEELRGSPGIFRLREELQWIDSVDWIYRAMEILLITKGHGGVNTHAAFETRRPRARQIAADAGDSRRRSNLSRLARRLCSRAAGNRALLHEHGQRVREDVGNVHTGGEHGEVFPGSVLSGWGSFRRSAAPERGNVLATYGGRFQARDEVSSARSALDLGRVFDAKWLNDPLPSTGRLGWAWGTHTERHRNG